MKKTFSLELTKDFWILCTLFEKTPVEILQFYVDHISLTMFVDIVGNNPYGLATTFFMYNTERKFKT
jgi:hypothetical protein